MVNVFIFRTEKNEYKIKLYNLVNVELFQNENKLKKICMYTNFKEIKIKNWN